MERAMSEKGSPLQPPRGTRDFYPDDLRFRDWLFDHFRAVSRSFGFESVDAPVLEYEELFTRKAGEEISDQLFHFELHDRRYALRPEFTPSLARMVMARAGSLRLPLRWTTVAQCWRYERMTRGRRREHYQWNMDIWGEPGVSAEAELIAAVFALIDRLGIVRGLAYYTGVVFEAFDAGRKLRAICGGGRYDGLLEALGGPAMPAVGFGFGDAVIEALLDDEGVKPACPRELDAVVFPFGEAERPAAIRMAQRLRAGGRSVELVLAPMKLKRALADADRAGARFIYLLGSEEVARG